MIPNQTNKWSPGLPHLYKNVGINKDPSRRHGPPMAILPTSHRYLTLYPDMSTHIHIYISPNSVRSLSHASSLLHSSSHLEFLL
jgi:hypothetical protein